MVDCESAFSCHQLCARASAGVIQLYIMHMLLLLLLLRILLDADENDVPCMQGQVHALRAGGRQVHHLEQGGCTARGASLPLPACHHL